MKSLILATIVAVSGTVANAQDFVYRPTNPSFGGDPFNSAHLLGMADRQNQFKDDGSSGFSRSPTASFERQIQSSLLSRIASQISEQIVGEDAKDSGRFAVGDTVISFQRIDTIVRIDVLGADGETTTIEIPAPVF